MPAEQPASPRSVIPPAVGVSHPVLVVEMLGAPGAGKSTLLPAVSDALRRQGYRPYTVEEAARGFVGRTRLGRLVGRAPDRWLPRLTWGMFRLFRSWHAAGFLARRPRLTLFLLRTQPRRPDRRLRRQREVVRWFLRLAGSHAFLSRHALPGEALVLDEGFLHRVVQLLCSPSESPDPETVCGYLDVVPAPDLVVWARAASSTCAERVEARGIWRRWDGVDRADVERFVANSHAAIELVGKEAAARGWSLVEIENEADDRPAVEERANRAVEGWLEGRGGGPGRPAGRPLFTLRVPRPGRFAAAAAARAAPAAIPQAVVDRAISALGTRVSGPTRNVSARWRNPIVVVDTGRGRVLLKQYPGRWDTETILHEHSILLRLAETGFPSSRLLRAEGGETLVMVEGQRFALFEWAPGLNLANSYLRPSERRRLDHLAGALLARLHRDLAGFLPSGRHHLGLDARTGVARRDLSWYLATLDELRADGRGRGEDERVERLVRAAPAVAAELERLHHRLADEELTTVVIHGDYGLHNILFDRAGTALVHDFELARVDWRLLDLIKPLSRRRMGDGEAFLAGYRQAGGDDSEWRLLPEVRRYHMLSGAVRSWHGHAVHGGRRRLETASKRLELAWGEPPW